MPPIVVLGAAGFIGRALVRRLAADGRDVIAVTRRTATFGPGIKVVTSSDLVPSSGWSRTLAGADAAIHLASPPHARSAGTDIEAWITAVAGTARHVAEEIARARVPQAILLSSVLVHGEATAEIPFRADQPLAPATPYARAKVRTEQEMRALLANSDTALAVIRPPLVYGPEAGYRFQLLLRLVLRAAVLPLAGIRNRRSMIYRENLVDLLSHILVRPKPVQGAYLARDDDELSTPELVRRIGARLGHVPALLPCPVPLLRTAGRLLGRSEIVDRLTQSLQVDDRATRLALDWSPPHGVDAGLAETCRWFLAQKKTTV
ncbi:MAG TPA: NAD-dependent epimerase/dehydratase family protein [Stellaceae bacterium]|nr:NAD-dependent epimerase/dehydratase family protein [Stellaceae bacterium]